MLLRFYRETMKMGNALPDRDIHDLRRAMGTEEDGTALGDVPKANRTLRGRSHTLELATKQHALLRSIKEEIGEGRPVIVVIKPKRGDRLGHSMVVKGLKPTGLRIVFDDPAQVEGEREMEQTEFLREWGNSGNVLILGRVDKKPPQQELEDFETE